MDLQRRLEVVEAENEALRARVRRLEDALAGGIAVPVEWGLTHSERLVLGVLTNRAVATKDAIMAALYRDLVRNEAEPKIVDVFVCNLRRKLRPFGVSIRTIRGLGYALDPAWRDRLRTESRDAA